MLRIPDVTQVFEGLQSSLADTPFSLSSLPGILLLLCLIGIVVLCVKKVGRMIAAGFGLLVLLEILHIIAYRTPIGSDVPILQTIFPYEPFTALAQLCVGTPVSDVFLWIQAFLNTVIGGAFTTVWHWLILVVDYFRNAWSAA